MKAFLVRLGVLALTFVPLSAAQEDSAAQPDVASSYYLFSRAYLKSLDHDFKGAIGDAELAIEHNPADSDLRLQYAKLLFQVFQAGRDVEMFEKSTEQAEKAIELDAENAQAHLLLGQIYYRLQRLEGAISHLEDAFRLNPDSYLAHYYAANIYMTKGDNEKAVEAFQNVVRLRPTAVQVYQLLASLLNELKRIDEAVATLEDGLRVAPGEFTLLEMLARIQRDRGNFEEAIEAYQAIELEALADPRESTEVRQSLGRLLYAAARYEEALPVLLQLAEENPDSLPLQSFVGVCQTETRRFDDAVETLRAVEEAGRPPRPLHLNNLYSLGRALEGLGQRQEAGQVFASLRDETSQPAEGEGGYHRAARIHLGLLAQRARRYDEAVEIFQGLMGEDPRDVRSAVWLAFALKDAGQGEEAAAVTTGLLEDNSGDWDLRVSHAQLLSALDRYQPAADFISQALESDPPESENPYLALNQIHADHEQFEDALQALESGLQRFPDNEALLFQRAATYERRKDFGQAEEEFRALLQRDPDNHSALNYLGYMLADQGIKLDEALQMIQKAVDAEPFNGAYLDSLGWAYLRLGKLDQAHKFLLQAIRLNENDPVLFEHLGDLYVEMENVEKARESYQTSLEFATEDDERERAQKKLRDLLR